jgi:hypothetical protein
LISTAFFDKKYFTQPVGQVHLWDPPEIAIKKNAIWNPATEGFAEFFVRIAIIWENFEQAKRGVLNDDGWELTPCDKFTHLRDISNANV